MQMVGNELHSPDIDSIDGPFMLMTIMVVIQKNHTAVPSTFSDDKTLSDSVEC